MKKKISAQQILEALETLIEASPLSVEDDPNATVDIRPDIEAGEAERVAKQPGLPSDAAEQSTLVKTHADGKWNQVIVTGPKGFWAIEMSDKGPTVQRLAVSREGRPYTMSDLDALVKFERNFQLDRTPWPGNIISSKNKVI